MCSSLWSGTRACHFEQKVQYGRKRQLGRHDKERNPKVRCVRCMHAIVHQCTCSRVPGDPAQPVRVRRKKKCWTPNKWRQAVLSYHVGVELGGVSRVDGKTFLSKLAVFVGGEEDRVTECERGGQSEREEDKQGSFL